MSNNQKMLNNQELSAFFYQMGQVLSAGISSVEGMMIMSEECDKKNEQNLLEQIQETLTATGSLYQGLESTKVFPEYALRMIELGEVTGHLDTCLLSLANHYDREAAIRQSIRQATTYPLIMILIMVAVVIILVTKVIPIFEQVFEQMGTTMTGISRAILSLGQGLNQHLLLLVIILLVLVFFILVLLMTEKGHHLLKGIFAYFPPARDYWDQLACCRFCSSMSMTLSSGMSLDESLLYAEKLADNERFSVKLSFCKDKMAHGTEFAKALLESSIFIGAYARMISIASRTGSIDRIMDEIAEKYQEETQQKLSGMISALEPTLVILLSLIVGLILCSVMLPLISILSSL